MKRNFFGDLIIDDVEDDLGDAIAWADALPSDLYAIIDQGDDGKWWFEIQTREDGDQVLSSLEIFESERAIRDYLAPWIGDVQIIA